jgi:CheY-like chemotaxis protein
LGFTELSLEISPGNDELHEYLNQVLLASRRARDLVAQMLAYSRGHVTEHRILNIEPLVRDIIKMLRASIPLTIDIVLHCEKNLPSVLCDSVHLYQLVINLCINARDALEGQGRIDIRVSKGSYTQQHCASCHELIAVEYLELSVTDGALGIKPEVMERMFDNFFTTKEVGKGTGMGLSTVHSIMHEIGGHILVESRLGDGSTFRLLFPWVEGKERDHALESVSTEANYASLTGKVLVVDDEVSLMRLAEEFLQSWGCEVTAVSSAQEALSIANQDAEPFDLIVTDYTMPGMNGAELLHEIKQKQIDLKAIMWSGYNEEVDEEQAREFGVDIYLNKPVRPGLLFEAVKSLLA